MLAKLQQQKLEEEERRKKFLREKQAAMQGAIPQVPGFSEAQMMEYGYMFLNGNVDEFLANQNISDTQKKQFLALASSSKNYQDFLVQAAT